MKSCYESCLDRALRRGGDFAELYLEDKEERTLRSSHGSVQGASSNRIHGAGLYLLWGDQALYTYSSDTSEGALMALADRAGELLALCRAGGPGPGCRPLVFAPPSFDPNPPAAARLPRGEKPRMLREAALAVQGTGLTVPTLNADLFESDQHITVINSQGLHTQDRRCATRIRLQLAVTVQGRSQHEWTDLTLPNTFDFYRENADVAAFSRGAAVDMAQGALAAPARGGVMPVVMEAGCGTLWHEACGHMLESAAICENTSPFAGRIGEKIASDKVTLMDDGAIPGLYGSTAIDDEGHPTQRNVLIEDGVLRGYLTDRLGARRLALPRSGSGRRQSYTFAPASRMNNTFLAPGEDDEEEMIRSVDRGLFVRRLGGGNSGRSFSIAVSEGYLIERGEITRRVRGLTLTGSGEQIMRSVDRVGRISQYEPSGGYCGASSGLVPVTAFQPRIRIAAMNVGGEG